MQTTLQAVGVSVEIREKLTTALDTRCFGAPNQKRIRPNNLQVRTPGQGKHNSNAIKKNNKKNKTKQKNGLLRFLSKYLSVMSTDFVGCTCVAGIRVVNCFIVPSFHNTPGIRTEACACTKTSFSRLCQRMKTKRTRNILVIRSAAGELLAEKCILQSRHLVAPPKREPCTPVKILPIELKSVRCVVQDVALLG